MGHVRINIEDSLHKNLKRRAIDEGIPMGELLVRALEEYMERNPPLPLPPVENKAEKTLDKPRRKRSSV